MTITPRRPVLEDVIPAQNKTASVDPVTPRRENTLPGVFFKAAFAKTANMDLTLDGL